MADNTFAAKGETTAEAENVFAFAKEVKNVAEVIYKTTASSTVQALVAEATVGLVPGISKEVAFERHRFEVVDTWGVPVLTAQALILEVLKPLPVYMCGELNITVDHDKRACVYTFTIIPRCKAGRQIYTSPDA